MRAFIVRLENRPGSLADLTEALGERGINISAVSGMTWDEGGGLGLITNDEAGTRSILDDRGADYREIELVSAELDDQPGSLGAAARRLAQKGVNIEAVIPTGMQGSRVSVAFGVNDAAAAREALGELAGTGRQAV
jgi:hypothetical protein